MLTPEFEFHWPIKQDEGSWEPLESWARPLAGVRIEGEHLRLEYRKPYVESRGPLELAHSDFRMLTEFAQLSVGDYAVDGRLLSFATRYGCLGLCKKHGWPTTHSKPVCPNDDLDTRNGFFLREPINAWGMFSWLSRNIVILLTEQRDAATVAAALSLKEAGFSSPDEAITNWLAMGELRLRFRHRPARLSLYGVPPLWTAIGLELAALAAGAKGIILCSVCGRLDSVKRPRHSNDERRVYCSRCRDKGRKRLGVADMRRREREARALRGQGKGVAEIAAQLGITAARVRRYLAKEKTNG